MILKIKKMSPLAQIPEYKTHGASGMDLHACFDEPTCRKEIFSGGRIKIQTGIAIELPEGYEAQVRPRSGLAANEGVFACFGTVDNDYRGELAVTLFNCSFKQSFINHGDRIAQLVIVPVFRVETQVVDELSTTERGSNGYGSTGR